MSLQLKGEGKPIIDEEEKKRLGARITPYGTLEMIKQVVERVQFALLVLVLFHQPTYL